MLGHKLVQVLGPRFDAFSTIRGVFSDIECLGIFDRSRTIEKIDATKFDSVRRALESTQPDVVINATGLVKQLPLSKDIVQTLLVNSIFPHLLAEVARELGFRLITVSTDCVFSGSKGNYSESDLPDATDLYGRSKQLGELTEPKCLTLRTSMIGREIGSSHGLIEWLLSKKGKVKGYTNAIFSGFPTLILAELMADIVEHHPDLEGLYHFSSDPIRKFELLMLIKERLGLEIEIEEFSDFRIDRSLDSSRFRKATGFQPLPWNRMVDRMFSDPMRYEDLRRIAHI